MAQSNQSHAPLSVDELKTAKYAIFVPSLSDGEYRVKFDGENPSLVSITDTFEDGKTSTYAGFLVEFTGRNGVAEEKAISLRSFITKTNTDIVTEKNVVAVGLVNMTDPTAMDVYDAVKGAGPTAVYVPSITAGMFLSRKGNKYRGDIRALKLR